MALDSVVLATRHVGGGGGVALGCRWRPWVGWMAGWPGSGRGGVARVGSRRGGLGRVDGGGPLAGAAAGPSPSLRCHGGDGPRRPGGGDAAGVSGTSAA